MYSSSSSLIHLVCQHLFRGTGGIPSILESKFTWGHRYILLVYCQCNCWLYFMMPKFIVPWRYLRVLINWGIFFLCVIKHGKLLFWPLVWLETSSLIYYISIQDLNIIFLGYEYFSVLLMLPGWCVYAPKIWRRCDLVEDLVWISSRSPVSLLLGCANLPRNHASYSLLQNEEFFFPSRTEVAPPMP